MKPRALTAFERAFLALVAYAAACGALSGQDLPHIAIKTSVALQTTRWVDDWTPAKHALECVRTHLRDAADSAWAWVQDSVESYTDSAPCAPADGVVVVLAPEFIRLGPENVLPVLTRLAQSHNLPWLCAVVGLSSANIAGKEENVPVEWCAWRLPGPGES